MLGPSIAIGALGRCNTSQGERDLTRPRERRGSRGEDRGRIIRFWTEFHVELKTGKRCWTLPIAVSSVAATPSASVGDSWPLYGGDPATVPEPPTLTLVGISGAVLAADRRRRRPHPFDPVDPGRAEMGSTASIGGDSIPAHRSGSTATMEPRSSAPRSICGRIPTA